MSEYLSGSCWGPGSAASVTYSLWALTSDPVVPRVSPFPDREAKKPGDTLMTCKCFGLSYSAKDAAARICVLLLRSGLCIRG